LSANQTTSFFFVSGFGSDAYSAKLLNGTRQRLSRLSQMRQGLGDDDALAGIKTLLDSRKSSSAPMCGRH
jgi:hypothetical protein